jgi:hypothetical protein
MKKELCVKLVIYKNYTEIQVNKTYNYTANLAIMQPYEAFRKIIFFVALRPKTGYGLLIHEVSRSLITTHRSPLDKRSARRRDTSS